MATLSDDPSGLELEDFVAAHLAARGRFVEIGITERDPIDVLELDVVWTDYDDAGAARHPVEVKSGDWGLGDLFKFYGWSRYLNLGPGWYFCRRLPGRVNLAAIERLCARLDITLCHVEELASVADRFGALGLPDPPTEWVPELWRYSFWVQRRLLKSLGAAIDAEVCPEAARAARDYQKLINDAVFFESDVRARVSSLMDAHWNHPRLARSAAAEIAGLGVDFEEPPDTSTFRRALFQGAHFPVQACLYLEQRARLAVMKASVDYIIARDAGTLPRRVVRAFKREFDLEDWKLYDAFRGAVEQLESRPTFRQYPVFWQTFLWSWGGFVLLDRIDAEYEQLSLETGVPVAEVEGALRMWDELFPTPGGWFATPTEDTRRQLKLMPAAVRALGAYRRLFTAGVEEYRELGLRDRTASRLASDNNAGVRLLDGDEEDLVK